jgi:hypothetical protein
MKAKLQIDKVESCAEWLETSAEDYTANQSIGWLIDQMGMLCKSMAFVNTQMAVSKEVLLERRSKAYNDLICSEVANAAYFAPSLAKDYIAAKCSKEQYEYDVCERTSRTLVHTIEALRTCISAAKTELITSNYQQP